MPAHSFNVGMWVSMLILAGLARAHVAAFHPAMYCVNGTEHGVVNLNNNAPVKPLYQLKYNEYWMHASNGCKDLPPQEGVFLDIPAGGRFTVELATNRASTSLNPHPRLSAWPDGLDHPENFGAGGKKCITEPNLHTQNETMAAGTAFAISYESDINKVTPENLVVFTVRYNTPWKRLTTYDVPAGLPACPKKGCIAAWVWIPNGCGIPNIYIFPYRARVIPDKTTPKRIGTPKPAVWCEDDPSKCVKGPKQVLIWHQAERNNIEVTGYDRSGHPKSPAYNAKCGFYDGAQNDIFEGSNTTHSKRMRRGKNVF